MEKKKCSLKEHSNINANIYCKKCEIYMCNKCEALHSKLFEKHTDFIINEDIEELINEFCEEETHSNYKLKYFCKTHDKLCCIACTSKVNDKDNGQHKDCDICSLEEIRKIKINITKENNKLLEEYLSKFDKTFNDIKKINENINIQKDELKLKIQKIFTNIRNILNNREDELLLEVDKVYNNTFFKEDFIKELEKLPNKIKLSLEKCNNLYNNDINIYKFIKEYKENEIYVKNINDINTRSKNILNSVNTEIIFFPGENLDNEFIERIKIFGKLNIIFHDIPNLSHILKDDIQSNSLIENWILEKIDKKQIKFELIFRMSDNGTKSGDFHKYCDNQGPTLILVKTTKNRIFGGFTPLNWNNNGLDITDNSKQTFIFSVNLKKKFDMIDEKKASIYCSGNEGPDFGTYDFYLKQNMKEGVTGADGVCNFLSNKNLDLTGGVGDSENFETEELEVYKVVY